ncbi:MAG: TolC family protein [Calditrichaeota bacterium]|nr:MAG: TolC family protein [Calditrichota bacterium]
MKIVWRWWIVFTGLMVGTLLAQSSSLLELRELIQEALANNPDLRAAEQRWQASLARIPQAGALPDPTLSFNLLNLPTNSFVFNQEAMTGKQVALMQMFPFPGKLGIKTDIARAGAAIQKAQYEELRNQLIKNVKTTFYSLYLVDRSIDIVEKTTDALKEFVRITETRYTVGTGLQQDVLRAQVELSRMIDRSIKLRQKREALEARLNALLNRPAGSPVARTPELEFVPLSLGLDTLQALAQEYRPLLKAWQAALRQSEEQIRLAKKEYFPDFTLTLAYTQRELLQNGMGGADFLTGKVGLRIPLYFWRKQRKRVEETRLMASATRHQYQQVLNQVYADLDRLQEDVAQYARLVDLFRTGIIPQAIQSLQSALAGYQTDKVDFLTLITNQINLFNFELDYYRVLSEYYKALAELEAATGTGLIERE